MLEIKNVSKSFPGVHALKNVSFQIEEGEVHALVGENGAGKSTLMRLLSGVYPRYEGEILFNGEPLKGQTPREAQAKGIAIIHQELSLIPELSVLENLFLGAELKTRFGTLDKKRMANEARALLSPFKIEIPLEKPIKLLRVGEQQLIEIARATRGGTKLLILDEPTSALADSEIERLFEVIGALKERGVTMIYISHKLDEIFRLSDRITVLRDGEKIKTLQTRETNSDELIRLMVGRDLKDTSAEKGIERGEEILRVEHLSLKASDRGRALEDISLRLHRGEIVGLAGLMGAGRSELLEAIFGVPSRGKRQGRVFVEGVERQFASPRDALAAGIAFVTEDRKGQDLVMELSIRENISLPSLKRFSTGGFLQKKAENEAASRIAKEMQVKASNLETRVQTLSGGNQQKTALAKCMMTSPTVLMLDEPTRGIDVGAKEEIYSLVRRLARQGAGVLLASSELPEILALCDRVLVLREGRLSGELTRAEATEEKILKAATKSD